MQIHARIHTHVHERGDVKSKALFDYARCVACDAVTYVHAATHAEDASQMGHACVYVSLFPA